MSDDLNKKIKQITDVLSQENLPDNLKGLFALLGSSANSQEEKIEEPAPNSIDINKKEKNKELSDLEDNMEMLRKVKTIMDRLNTGNDPRINLLSAIKPFLNNNRQKKLSNCISLLKVSSLAKLVEENGKEIL